MKRKIITCVLTLVFVLCAFSTIAYAKNFDIRFLPYGIDDSFPLKWIVLRL